jgi:hypothetical protein
MSDKPSKDEALEALDFIVNVLKEHEKDLDKLVGELGTLAEQMGETGELNGKVKKIEEKIVSLQNEVGNLLRSISSESLGASPKSEPAKIAIPTNQIPLPHSESDIPLMLHCKQWNDFQTLAASAQAVSFGFKEGGSDFEVGALRNNKLVTFHGELPGLSTLLKVYLSKQLVVSEKQIVEGTIKIG